MKCVRCAELARAFSLLPFYAQPDLRALLPVRDIRPNVVVLKRPDKCSTVVQSFNGRRTEAFPTARKLETGWSRRCPCGTARGQIPRHACDFGRSQSSAGCAKNAGAGADSPR